MTEPVILSDLTRALRDLELVRPYSSNPTARTWRGAIVNLRGIEAVLIAIDAFRPGLLRALEASAIDEMLVVHDEPIPEVTALIQRYARRLEPLR